MLAVGTGTGPAVSAAGDAVAQRIAVLLEQHRAPYTPLHHLPATSSAQMAHLRGTPLRIGGKSLVFKVGSGPTADFRMFVISAGRRTSNRALRRHLGIQRMRFATPAELLAQTGLTPGCIPPFGHPIFDMPLYLDTSIAQNDEIAFSVGLHTRSFHMRCADYIRIAQPTAIFSFALTDDPDPTG